jgi:hypothetical protein
MSVPMKSLAPSAQQLAYRRALEAAMAQHAASLDAVEILAVLSHMVGQVIALQDQRTMTSQMAMAIVANNIEHGNREVVDRLLTETGGHA